MSPAVLLKERHQLLGALDRPPGHDVIEHPGERLAEGLGCPAPRQLEREERILARRLGPRLGARKARIDRRLLPEGVAFMRLARAGVGRTPDVVRDGPDAIVPAEATERAAQIGETQPAFLLIAPSDVEKIGEQELVVDTAERLGAVERLLDAAQLAVDEDDEQHQEREAERVLDELAPRPVRDGR